MYTTKSISSSKFTYGSNQLRLDGMPVTKEAIGNLSTFYQIPKTLFLLQNRTKANIVEPVLRELPKMTPVIKENKIEAFVKPGRVFVDDESFNFINSTLDIPTIEFKPFKLENYTQKLILKRPLTGGLALHTELMRLVCMNGATVNTKGSYKVFSDLPKNLQEEVDNLKVFDMEGWMESIFGKDCNRPASVANLMDMVTSFQYDSETKFQIEDMEKYFPLKQIRNHYLNHNIDIYKSSRKSLQMLHAGISYYNCFNFLTYVATHKMKRSIERDVRISSFLSPTSAKEYEYLNVSGAIEPPNLDISLVLKLSGDIK